MPGFSFASGNAKKLAALPLYALGAVASMFVPRLEGHWVFGCGSGIGEGSLALYRYASGADASLRLTWLARDERDLAAATALGIPAVLKLSRRGLWLTLRARVAVVTHGFGDVNRFGQRGAVIVQLWHGIPLKLIQLDSAATTTISVPVVSMQLRNMLRRFYRRGYRGIALMPAASELAATRLRTAFALPTDRVVVTGDPRDDVLSNGDPGERQRVARAVLVGALDADPGDSRLLLYAPTWRDGEADPGVPTAEEWCRIDAWLRDSGAVLIVRPHPNGVGDYAAGIAGSPRIQLLSSARQSDLTPLLAAVDLLITDYSSVAFDFSLTGGPILFIAPDEEDYTASRGLYEPYREFSGGREVRSWTAILDQLDRFDTDPEWAAIVRAHSAALASRHFTFRDGRNTERVFSELTRRLQART
ncbi:CDP-glycerol glycerophosphotransferase family protein [Frigoribacterium sp. CG_9.8]|uniref:CDP-glycerol glycerophosphotransferase family protein n=1 Tax=Frigoribacterium sp. CG_9.8 TaxID=2787733 RepID=UPI0018C9C4D0|nr:CDP-glycerol glycerophosphotransferase family protein [Frigoribacterium sp. CG_9.8]MBG6107542.1 CDP-glycerol glycerophosphotransferase [Frigoribacterium sp. CG_9.8]